MPSRIPVHADSSAAAASEPWARSRRALLLLLPSLAVLSAALWLGRDGAAVEQVSRTETALIAHVAAQDLRARGELRAAHALYEQACRMGHEPSCAQVWVRLDMEVPKERDEARAKLTATAEGLVQATDGAFFLHLHDGTITARVYCPASREEDLELALSRLRWGHD